jgi:hypothetical protein
MQQAERSSSGRVLEKPWGWWILALLLFLLGTFFIFRPWLGSDLRHESPVAAAETEESQPPPFLSRLELRVWDERYTIWAITRNARAILRNPTDVFGAGQCYPAEQALALGHSVLTPGLLGVPALLFTDDPVLIHNLVLLASTLISPLSMLGLVWLLTGSPVAGLVAGILYGFHPSKIGDPSHFYLTDTVWTVFALLFAVRLFRHRLWVDSIGLAASCILQLGAGIYPTVGAAVLAPFFLVGLMREEGLKRKLVLQLAVSAALVAGAGWLLLNPYLTAQEIGILEPRGRIFHTWNLLAPGQRFFMGWPMLLLVIAALVVPTPSRPARTLRWLLLAAAALVTLLAVGDNVWGNGAQGDDVTPPPVLFNPYDWLVMLAPGLAAGRAPAFISTTAHVALSVLAGTGCAAILQAVSTRWRPFVAAGLVVATFGLVVFPAELGLRRAVRFESVRQSPTEEALDFFRELERLGNSGPILELPIPKDLTWWSESSARLAVAAYHRRQTSNCFASYSRQSLAPYLGTIKMLPAAKAVAELRSAGWTTIVLHRKAHGGRMLRIRFDRAVGRKASPLRKLHETPSLTAYTLGSG